ncbi:hypothetical protein Tco_0277414 [Tanacetum coccineum]
MTFKGLEPSFLIKAKLGPAYKAETWLIGHHAVSLWTRNIVIRKQSYQTKLNLEQPNWDASDIPFKEDYTIMSCAHVSRWNVKKNPKKSWDFMVKDFKYSKFNKGMENRKWTKDDKRRSEDFIEVIERRLKIWRIFRSLESFVGGRLRDIDYRLISRTE